MPGIFISYRRSESSGHAGRLRDRLRARFGDLVFQDVDDIPDGEVFSDVIDRALKSCNVALIVIGRDWATTNDDQGRRRLDDPDDWVRVETAMVLARKIRVVPVLVGGAKLPAAEHLPDELKPLVKRQARELRDSTWDADVAILIQRLQEIIGLPGARERLGGLLPWKGIRTWILVTGVAIVLAIGGSIYLGSNKSPPAPVAAVPEPTASTTSPTTSTVTPKSPQEATDLSGYWRDDSGVLYKIIPRKGGGYEMGQIEPPEQHASYRNITVDGRDVQISIGVLPSGTQQARARLGLSVDGNILSGLLTSTQIEEPGTNWVLKRVRDGASDKPSTSVPRSMLPGGIPAAMVKELSGLRIQIRSIAFSPDGRSLAAAGFRVKDTDQATALVWETADWQVARTLGPHTNDVYAVAFSPDGRTIGTATWGAIKLWNAQTGAEMKTLIGQKNEILTLAFSRNGSWLASGGEDRTVRLWDVASGREVRAITAHSEAVKAVAFSPDGKLLASGGNYSSDSKKDFVALWDVTTGSEVRRLSMPGAQNSGEALAFSPDGKWLAAGSFGETKLWSTRDWSLRLLPNSSDGSLHVTVWSVTFSLDSKVMATVDGEKNIRFWEVDSGKPIKTLEGKQHSISALAYSPDGKWFASAGQLDRSVRLWQ